LGGEVVGAVDFVDVCPEQDVEVALVKLAAFHGAAHEFRVADELLLH
jgi:hypothetical protein